MSTYYHTCPDCGANLDPGERCTCEDEMPKVYRKNGLVLVEALLWTGKNHAIMEDFLTTKTDLVHLTNTFYYDFKAVECGLILKHQMKPDHPVKIGEYIVRDEQGIFDAYNSVTFDLIFDLVEFA